MRDDDLMLAADWSELPVDLLGLITDKLKNTYFLLEYIRFGAVCFEWRSFIAIQNYDEHIKLPSKLPLLLIPTLSSHEEDYNFDEDEHDDNDYDNNHGDEDVEQEIWHDEDEDEEEQLEMPYNNYYYYDDGEDELKPLEHYYKRKGIWKGQDAETRHKSTRSFYSLSQRKVYQNFLLPVPYYKNCRGSSHGWLITVDEEEEEEQADGTTTYTYPVRLLNPFRSVNNEIQLPPLTPIPELDEEPGDSYYLIKAYLSANPSSLSNPADLLVLAVYGCNMFGFCRPGDSAWTHFPLERGFRPIEDLICYKGRFLAIIQNGSVLEFDDFAHHHLHPKLPSVKFVARTPANAGNLTLKYLVESAGDLLQVQRNVIQQDGDDNCSTLGFRVFKLNANAAANDDDNEWVEMDNLDGRMLFLGDNNSISLSATDFPGLMSNCIYFTDDYYEYHHADPRDFGIFNLVDKSVVSNFDDKNFDRLYATHKHIMPPPIWIQPMLYMSKQNKCSEVVVSMEEFSFELGRHFTSFFQQVS